MCPHNFQSIIAFNSYQLLKESKVKLLMYLQKIITIHNKKEEKAIRNGIKLSTVSKISIVKAL